MPPGVSRYPYIAADLRARILSREREPGAGLPACRALAQWYGVNRDTLAGRRLGRPAGRRVGGYGAQSEYIKVRSVVYDRAESVRAQQVAAAGPQIPQAHIGRTVWPAVQVPCEHQREQAGGPGEIADRVVLGDLAELTTRSWNTRESPT